MHSGMVSLVGEMLMKIRVTGMCFHVASSPRDGVIFGPDLRFVAISRLLRVHTAAGCVRLRALNAFATVWHMPSPPPNHERTRGVYRAIADASWTMIIPPSLSSSGCILYSGA